MLPDKFCLEFDVDVVCTAESCTSLPQQAGLKEMGA